MQFYSTFSCRQQVVKLFICLAVLTVDHKNQTLPSKPSVSDLLPYTVPALCYCVNNNLAVALQQHMDPATYMVMGILAILPIPFIQE